MALPPYFITMVCPEREWSEEAMVLAFSTKGLASSATAKRDVAACLVVGVREYGTKAFVAVPRTAAITMELAEKSFMVV